MLYGEGINCFYGLSQILWDVCFEIREGEIVALIGSNGAGKTTLLKTISGLIRPKSGVIKFGEQRIEKLPPHKIVETGIVLVPEDGGLFPFMTVLENLKVGAYLPANKRNFKKNLHQVFQLFPNLAERKNQLAGTLSGGERKMLAIGKGLMTSPEILLLDEPSWGLAPNLVIRVLDTIQELNKRGMTILLAEQNVYHSLELASRAFVIENGKIVLQGRSNFATSYLWFSCWFQLCADGCRIFPHMGCHGSS